MQRIDSWSRPTVPQLPGAGAPVHLFDAQTGQVQPVAASAQDASAPVRLYVCGITPYDATHLGHAATYLAFDTLVRALLQAGHEVEYSQNVTDVDDPLLERAARTGVDWQDLATAQTDLFRTDMTALRVMPPTSYVRVQDVVPEVAAAVAALLRDGYAYRVPTPDAEGEDIYFDIIAAQHDGHYTIGAISHYSPQRLASAFVEFGGDPERVGKRCPLDPLLWRAARVGEPSWPAEIGAGRPGWHVECAVIATGTLGAHIDVQAGGRDLRFPHHEMTAAHAGALTGQPFAGHYTHAGLVAHAGEKMSKSLGNLVLVSKLREAGHDARAIRLAILAHHYRSDWEWHDDDLAAAEARLERWVDAAARATQPAPHAAQQDAVARSHPHPSDQPGLDAVAALRAAVADDLNTPRALELVDAWANSPSPTAAVVAAVDALLGVELSPS